MMIRKTRPEEVLRAEELFAIAFEQPMDRMTWASAAGPPLTTVRKK